jgi:hypothetical protein
MRLRIITELAIDPNLAHTLNKFDRYAQPVKFPLLLGFGTILRSGRRTQSVPTSCHLFKHWTKVHL